MGKKRIATLAAVLLATSVGLAACGNSDAPPDEASGSVPDAVQSGTVQSEQNAAGEVKADEAADGLVVELSENVLEWCEKHEVEPKEFGVSWLQKQAWNVEKQESKLTIDYPVDVENAYELFDEYYEWYISDSGIKPDTVINDEILISGWGRTASLSTLEYDNGTIYHNDIYAIVFANYVPSDAKESYISVKDAYEKGWFYFVVSPAAIGLSNEYREASDKKTREQMLNEIVNIYGTPDYLYAHSSFNTIADMVAFNTIGEDGEDYLERRVVKLLFYGLVYDYGDYVVYVSVDEEDIGYDTKRGTVDTITLPNIYVYPRECWEAKLALNDSWSLHTLK